MADGLLVGAGLLRRAAARLEELDAAATPLPWTAHPEDRDRDGDVPVRTPSGFLCESPDDGVRGGHAEADAALIVALRAAAGPVAVWLRSEADRRADRDHRWSPHAEAVARAVLGEEAARG